MNILIPLDGTKWSEEILPWLAPMLARGDTHAHLLHVAPFPEPGSDVTHAGPEGCPADAKRYVERAVKRLKAKASVEGHAWQGEPVISIRRCARELKADLVAMRTHARAGVSRLIFGSVTSAVLTSSDVPVYAVGPGAKPPKQAALKRIAVPLDGSPLAEQILDDAVPLAKLFGAEIRLFHAGADAKVLDRALKHVSSAGVAVAAMTRPAKKAADAVIAEAEESDLIAMTTHGRSGLTKLVLGSVAEAVVRSCRIPMLLRRPKG